MNFRQRLRRLCTLCCGCVVILWALSVARPILAATIPLEIKTATDADKHRAEIAAVVKSGMDDILGEDLAKRAKARDALIGELNAPANQPYSAAFIDIYCQEINNQLMPVADNKDPRIRMTAAIIVARLAEKIDSQRLFPITEKLLHDKSDAVLIWALKAARFVLPAMLTGAPPLNANQQKLLAAIESHADDPVLLPLVYDALTLTRPDGKVTVPNRDKMLTIVVPEMLKLLQSRIQQYQQGVPGEPAAVVPAVLFLSNPTTWTALNAEAGIQMQIIQTLADLIGVAGQRALVAGNARSELEFVIQKAAAGLGAIALTTHDQPVFAALQPLIHSGSGNQNLPALLAGLPGILKQHAAWAAIKPAPAIQSNSSTSAPTTTTSPAK